MDSVILLSVLPFFDGLNLLKEIGLTVIFVLFVFERLTPVLWGGFRLTTSLESTVLGRISKLQKFDMSIKANTVNQKVFPFLFLLLRLGFNAWGYHIAGVWGQFFWGGGGRGGGQSLLGWASELAGQGIIQCLFNLFNGRLLLVLGCFWSSRVWVGAGGLGFGLSFCAIMALSWCFLISCAPGSFFLVRAKPSRRQECCVFFFSCVGTLAPPHRRKCRGVIFL